ncbi:MAG TPA: heterodisulfide reductase-related iron-sulfur binding cluster [Gemmatimonadales bacterium]|jgi:glycolate oxidase iron-sulfur subunit|nr:heterodisulfide reductase-related iron-sulfur binding cluster [Gemmatimonadales bacterium]
MTRGGFEGLDACVHCGFCLQACPTFLATGDESDSPRGRIELMRALERGELSETDTALVYHLDRCLGCRGCEPVCPSGVQYGHGLEAARARITAARGASVLTRLALWALTTAGVSSGVYWLARLLRATGLPRLFAGWGRLRFAMGMLSATGAVKRFGGSAVRNRRMRTAQPPNRQTAQLFRGCVMQGLFSHVHDATIRTLAVNGYQTVEVSGQVCCGALHAHAGLVDEARALARTNVAAFGDGDEPIVVNSAGCGALMKEYGHLLGDERAARFSARVRDVTELLAGDGGRGPVAGAPLDLHVAYDPPCHLLHAQRIAAQPLKLFAAIPLLELVSVQGAADCCGSAGLFTLLEPEMSRAVLKTKLEYLREAAPQVVATGNPGCLMQLGAGLAAAGIRAEVRHPVELLDDAYRAAGRYE